MERGCFFTRLQNEGVELSSLARGCVIQRGYAVQGASVTPLSCPPHIGAGFDVVCTAVRAAFPGCPLGRLSHWRGCCR